MHLLLGDFGHGYLISHHAFDAQSGRSRVHPLCAIPSCYVVTDIGANDGKSSSIIISSPLIVDHG